MIYDVTPAEVFLGLLVISIFYLLEVISSKLITLINVKSIVIL